MRPLQFILSLLKKLKREIENFLEPLPVCGSGSGSGNTNHICEYIPRNLSKVKNHHFHLLRREHNDIVGKGRHRSGWPEVIKALAKFDTADGILLDDFVEQNFCYREKPHVYKEPWIGIFHHPPFPPKFSNRNEWMTEYLRRPEFQESKKYLKAAIVLSAYHVRELAKHLDCPILSIHHPVECNFEKWSESNWLNNSNRQLVQIGWYLRNTQLIFQIPKLSHIRKTRLWSSLEWVNNYDKKVRQHWDATGNRPDRDPDVTDQKFLPPSAFDKLLANNVVAMEFFDASAANGILDCIARNTPVCVNAHPAVVEYLGEDYPLYFTRPAQIPGLLTSAKLLEAHNYLSNLDKTRFSTSYFTSKVMDVCRYIIA